MKTEQAIDATVLAVSNKATVFGGGTSLLGFVASMNWLGILGFLIALTGLLVSWYYSSKKNAREEAEHQARMAEYDARLQAIKSDCEVDHAKAS